MHTQDANQSISQTKGRKRRWVVLAGCGAVLAILALAVFWFIEHRIGPKPVSPAPASSPGVSMPQASVPSDEVTATTDPEINLTTDDLKKAQIHSARVNEALDGTHYRIEERPLAVEHPRHIQSQGLDAQQKDPDIQRDLQPTIQCHRTLSLESLGSQQGIDEINQQAERDQPT